MFSVGVVGVFLPEDEDSFLTVEFVPTEIPN